MRSSLVVKMGWGILSISLCLLDSPFTWAFHLEDHKKISTEALRSLDRCLPQFKSELPMALRSELVRGVLREDKDLWTKWTQYSHFFHPRKDPLKRKTSLDRIRHLKPKVLEMRKDDPVQAAFEFGRLVHHLQDAAVPAHIALVSHFVEDSFEDFYSGDDRLFQDPSGPWADQIPCESMKAQDPVTLLYQAAEGTLSAIHDSFVVWSMDHGFLEIPWTYFWMESPHNDFGSYGILGNRFGQNQFEIEIPPSNQGKKKIFIPKQNYVHFKSERILQGIESTVHAIIWYLSEPMPFTLR